MSAVLVEVSEDPVSRLQTYASIPGALMVEEVFDVHEESAGPEGVRLIRRELTTPYIKDYDRPDSEHPSRWSERFDVTRWGFLTGTINGRDVARAAIVWDAPGVDLLAGREDSALLWDIRVAPAFQRRGVGSTMFRAVEDWARQRGAVRLLIETQNVNVAACSFYQRQGCYLGGFQRFAYSAFPEEVQLLWFKELSGRTIFSPLDLAAHPIIDA